MFELVFVAALLGLGVVAAAAFVSLLLAGPV